MAEITVFYQNLTGNVGEGWRDDHEAGLAYAKALHEALMTYLENTYPDARIDVQIESQRASGASRGFDIVSDLSGREEMALHETLNEVASRAWETFCETRTDLYDEE